MKHESYEGYKPRQPLGRSGGLSVETHIADPAAVPLTKVDSPLTQMKELPAKFNVIRPQRQLHPHFIVSQGNADLQVEESLAPETDTGAGKFIGEVAQSIDASELSAAEINSLIAVMDAAPGELQGWTNLTDVWD